MSKFFKGKWRGIPTALITSLVLLALTAGIVYAAVNIWSGKLDVTVEECVTLEWWNGSTWVVPAQGGTVTAYLKPGESKDMLFRASNTSSGEVSVKMNYTLIERPSGGAGKVTLTEGFIIETPLPGGTVNKRGDITISASSDAPVGEYKFELNFSRH